MSPVLKLGCTGPCKTSVIVEIPSQHEVRLLDRKEWKSGFPCPSALCGGRLVKDPVWASNNPRPPVVLTAEEFFRKISGQGYAPPHDVERVFLSKHVVGVDWAPVGGTDHTIVQRLIFENGAIMHFGVSSHGACIYKLEEPSNELHTDAVAKSGDPHREEAGRDDSSKHAGADNGRTSLDDSVVSSESTRTTAVSTVSETGEVPTGAAESPD